MHQPKDTDWLGGWKHLPVCTSTYHMTVWDSPNYMWLFHTAKLIMFPLWLTIIFFVWLLIVKLINVFYSSESCNYYSLNTIVWLVNRKRIKLCFHRNASVVAQMVTNLPTMQETWVQSLGWKIPWRRAGQPTPVFLPGESHRQSSLAGYSPWGCKESDTTEWLTTAHFHQKLGDNRKTCNHLLKSGRILELSWHFFWKIQMLRCCFFLQSFRCF